MRTYWVPEIDGSIAPKTSNDLPILANRQSEIHAHMNYWGPNIAYAPVEVAIIPAATIKGLVEELTRIYTESVNTAQMFGEEDDDSRQDKLADRMADQRRDFIDALAAWKEGAK